MSVNVNCEFEAVENGCEMLFAVAVECALLAAVFARAVVTLTGLH